MAPIRRLAAWLTVAALAFAGGAVAQTTVDLSLDEARGLALQAVLAGDYPAARLLAAALLERDPDDRTALVVLAAAEPQMGRPAQGRMAAARAFRLGRDDGERYEAARLAALAAANEERFLLAGIWLRRALTVAPSAEEAARTRDDAARLRNLAPWKVDVGLAFGPSGNVNGGADDEILVIDGRQDEGIFSRGILSVDAQALSGWTGTLDFEAARRLVESPRARTELGFRLYAREVTLSEEARDLIAEETEPGDETFTGSDFSQGLVEITLGHDRVLGRAIVDADLSVGQNWYGRERSLGTVRLSAGGSWRLGARQSLRFSGFVEDRWDRRNDEWEDGGVRRGLSAGWRGRAGEVADLSLTLGRVVLSNENRNAASTSWSLRAGVAPVRAFGPARLSMSLGVETVEFPDYRILIDVPGGRRDERLTASVEAAFVGWDYAGFVPVVSLQAERSLSNVSRFEHEGLGIGFALRSSF